MSNNSNIIFYSQQCNTSIALLTLLKNEGLLQYFNLYCVDGRTSTLPKHIQYVPTMIVANINKPLVARDAFEWVSNMKYIRQQNIIEQNKKLIQKNNNNNINTGPRGFVSIEMNEFSDKFAFADNKIDISLPQSFVDVNDLDKNSIFTVPESKDKISSKELKDNIKKIANSRDKQDEEFNSVWIEQQKYAIDNSKRL